MNVPCCRHSVQEMQVLLQQNVATLDLARFGLDNMVQSYPGYVAGERGSTVSAIGSEDGVLGDRDSILSDTRFAFDTICFDSKAYRHTVARVSAKKKLKRPERRAAPSPSDTAALLPIKEAEAETDNKSSGETSTPAPATGVSNEEHEAVIMKLQEAEALIRTLQERLQQPTAPTEDQQADDPSQPPGSVEGKKTAKPAKSTAANTGGTGAAEPDGEASDSGHDSYYTTRYEESPITIKTPRTASNRASRTQTKLLIEYFSKQLEGAADRDPKAPTVRVRIPVSRRAPKVKDQPVGAAGTPVARDDQRTKTLRHGLPRRASSQKPVLESAAADTVSGTVVSSIPPCSFLDGTDAKERPLPNGISSIPTAACLDGTPDSIGNPGPSVRRKSGEWREPKRRKASIPTAADTAGIPDSARKSDRLRPAKHRSGETREPETQKSAFLTSLFLDGAPAGELGERRKRTTPRRDVLNASRSLGEKGQTRNSLVYRSRWPESHAGRGIIDLPRDEFQRDTRRGTKHQPKRVEELRRGSWDMPEWNDEADHRTRAKQQGTQRTPLKDATNLEREKVDQDKTADTASPTTPPPPPTGVTTTYKLSWAGSTARVCNPVEAKNNSSSKSDDEMIETLQPSIPPRSRQRDDDSGRETDAPTNNAKVNDELRATLLLDPSPTYKRRSPDWSALSTATNEAGQKEGRTIAGPRPHPGVNNNPGWINPERVVSEISKNTDNTLRVVSSRSGLGAGTTEDRAIKRSPFGRADERPGSVKRSDLERMEDMLGKLLADLDEIKVRTQQAGDGGAVEAASEAS